MRQYLLSACALMAACVTGSNPQQLEHARLAVRDPRYLAVAGELEGTESGSAYDLIWRLRPEFLMSRGSTSLLLGVPDTPEVYVDGMRRGGTDELRYILAGDVLDVRFYPMSAVPVRLGGSHTAGVIEVRTRSR